MVMFENSEVLDMEEISHLTSMFNKIIWRWSGGVGVKEMGLESGKRGNKEKRIQTLYGISFFRTFL